MHLWFIQPHAKWFWCEQIHYKGKWEGVGPWKVRVFWALWNGIEPLRKCHLGPKKLKISRAQPPLTCSSNGFARIKNHYVQRRINQNDPGLLQHHQAGNRLERKSHRRQGTPSRNQKMAADVKNCVVELLKKNQVFCLLFCFSDRDQELFLRVQLSVTCWQYSAEEQSCCIHADPSWWWWKDEMSISDRAFISGPVLHIIVKIAILLLFVVLHLK